MAWVLFVVAGLVLISAVVFSFVPFAAGEERPGSPSACGPAVAWLVHPTADERAATKHDYFWSSCRYLAHVRLFLAAVSAGAVWFFAALVAWRRPLPTPLQRVVLWGSVLFAATATILAVVFGLATSRNPYPNIERLWTSALSVSCALAALAHWLLALGLRRSLATGEPPVIERGR